MMRWTALMALGLVTAMSGCGADQGAGGSASGAGSGSATSVNTSADPGTNPMPPGPSGSPPAIVAGEVSVRLNAGGYSTGQVIGVIVSNGMDRPVYTEDFKTACSIVILQRRDNSAWTDIVGCALGRPTATVTLEPGRDEIIDFDPASVHLTYGGSGPAFGPGTYRVKFTYRVELGAAGPDPLTAYSPEFPIR